MPDGKQIAADIRQMLLVREGRWLDRTVATERANNIAQYVLDLLVQQRGLAYYAADIRSDGVWPERHGGEPLRGSADEEMG